MISQTFRDAHLPRGLPLLELFTIQGPFCLGRQEIVVCGGAEELHDKAAMCFDVMNALSTSSIAGERSAPTLWASGKRLRK